MGTERVSPSGWARAHVQISGMVQGVGFRIATQHEASRHDVRGWVRNTGESGVEAVFEGRRQDVEAMVAWCWQGPTGAWVRNVDVKWDEPPENPPDFRVRVSMR